MIDWIYSDPVRIGFVTGVRRDDQNFVETTKTVVGASNRSRVVTDIMYDDCMKLERPWVPSESPSPCGDSQRLPEQPSWRTRASRSGT